MIQPGQRFMKNGIAVDVHKVEGGEVYYRRWPKDVEEMPWCAGLARMALTDFATEVGGITPEPAVVDSDLTALPSSDWAPDGPLHF